MKIGKLEAAMAGLLVFAPVVSANELSSEVRDEAMMVSGEIARYARANGVKKIAVLGFTSIGCSRTTEEDAVSESVSSYISFFSGTTPDERSRLKETLAALKNPDVPGPTGAAKMLEDLFSVDAVVTGALFAAGGDIHIRAKLNDVRTRKLLFTASAGKGGVRRGDMPAPSAALPGFPGTCFVPDIAGTPPPGDLRDAVSDHKEGACAGRKRTLAQLNEELLDAKARYWAEKLRDPLFGRRTDRRNPGIELADPAARGRFYALLAAYYQAGKRKEPGPEKLAAVLDLMESETRFFAECGLP